MVYRITALTICILLGLCFQAVSQSCPEPSGHWGYGEHPTAVWHGDLALIASGPKLLVVDFRLDAPPSIIGEVRLPGNAIALAVAEDLAVAGVRGSHSSDALLVTVDLSLPSEPVVLGHLGIARALSDVALWGSVALVTSLSEGLVLVDVSDPADPRRLSALPTVRRAQSVVVRGDSAYLGSWVGLITVDIAHPTQPSIVSQQSVSGLHAELALSDTNLFFLSEDELTVFDLSDPARPTRLSSFEPSGSPANFDVAGTTAFVTQYRSGGVRSMAIIDATDPLELRRIGTYDPGRRSYHVAAAPGAALLSMGVSGLTTGRCLGPDIAASFRRIGATRAPGRHRRRGDRRRSRACLFRRLPAVCSGRRRRSGGFESSM